MHRYFVLGSLFTTLPLLATDYAFLDQEAFVREKSLWHFESDYSKVGAAKCITTPVFGSSLHYAEGNASMHFSHFIDQENALSWQLGANYTEIDWKENPRFSGSNYTYGIASLSWISFGLEQWRWVTTGGVAVDTYSWNFGKSAVYYAMAWGRYAQQENLGIHMGFFAYYGALNGYVLPILGVDFWPTRQLEIRGIFPLDASINYHFTPYFSSCLLATSMGGPYRFPRRAHGGTEGYNDAIFKVYSNALEWDIEFAASPYFYIGAGAGYDFGGWIQIADSHSHHKEYYHFEGAPFGRGYLSLTF